MSYKFEQMDRKIRLKGGEGEIVIDVRQLYFRPYKDFYTVCGKMIHQYHAPKHLVEVEFPKIRRNMIPLYQRKLSGGRCMILSMSWYISTYETPPPGNMICHNKGFHMGWQLSSALRSYVFSHQKHSLFFMSDFFQTCLSFLVRS